MNEKKLVITKFNLIKYLQSFQHEVICTNPFEVKNKNKKEFYEKFSINNRLLAENSPHFDKYQDYEEKFKPIDRDNFSQILNKKKFSYYYNYYIQFIPVTYAIELAVREINDKTVFKLNENIKFKLLPQSVVYLTFLTICLVYDTLDLDNFSQNRFYKKRVVNELINLFKDEVNININFNIIINLENIEEFEILINQWKKFCIKILWYVEDIFVELCFGLPYINYGYSYNTTNSTVYKHPNDDVENSEASILNESEDEILIHTSEKKDIQKYTHNGIRFLIFSRQVNCVRDLSLHIFKEKPWFMENKIVFPEFQNYDIFTYNTANNKYTSSFKFNLDIVIKLILTPIVFDKNLYNSVKSLLSAKYSSVKHISNITKLSSINMLFNNLFTDTNILSLYFPYIIDFRGRIYVNSPLSITDIKLLRQLIRPQNISKDKNIKKNYFYNKIRKYTYLLKKLHVKSSNLLKFTEEKQVIILVGLLNLGKIQKSRLLENYSVSIENFIKNGIELFNEEDHQNLGNGIYWDDIDDMGTYITLKFKLKNYIETDELFSIILDSTASGIFHLNIWLNIKDDYKKFINLNDEDRWYDTYSFLFSITKSILGEKFPNDLLHLFTRKRLKKLYMTLPYNATKYTLRQYFYLNMSEDDKVKIKPYLNEFIDAIYKTFDSVFTNKINDFCNLKYFNNSFKFKLNSNYFDFTYYQTDLIEKSVTHNGMRWSYTELKILTLEEFISKYEDKQKIKKEKAQIKHINNSNYRVRVEEETKPTSNINFKKSKIAFTPNVMHCSDATFLYKIFVKLHEQNIYIHTVHDEFILPINNVFEFLEVANLSYCELYSEVNGKNFESKAFFILL